MRAAGLATFGDAKDLGVTGFFEVIARLPIIWRAYRTAIRTVTDPGHRPDLAILIDYPDFNLRLARAVSRAGVPLLYFISPQIWAWRPGRMRTIAASVNHLLVILPFEKEIYRDTGLEVTYVGHPLSDLAHPGRDRSQTLSLLGLDPDRPTISLLPGSRKNELRAHFPAMLGAARRLREEFRDLQFLVPLAPTVARQTIEREITANGPWPNGAPIPVVDDRYDAIAASDAAVVASGTATLECALLGVPMVIVYRVNPLTYIVARRASSLNHAGLPNLIAGKRIVAELLQDQCAPAPIARELRAILVDPPRAAEIRAGLSTVRERLGGPGAIEKAARVAWSMIGTPHREPVA